MFRIALALGATAVALAPATLGLLGNNTLSQDVPVRVPVSAQVLPAGDATPTPSATRGSAAGDDHGGDRRRDDRVEPGDDRDAQASGSPSHHADDDRRGRGSEDAASDDHRGRHGSHHANDDHGRHGSDD